MRCVPVAAAGGSAARRITRVVVTCGAPTQNSVNRVTLRVTLGGGDDTFTAAPWDDVQPRIVADGGAGNDTIYGSTNPDEIDGGAGDDMLYGLDDEDNLDGGDGADLLVGGAGDDGLTGGPGTDRYFGDELRATSEWGNDVLIAVDGGPETMNCGEGVDSAVVDADDAADATCEVLSGGQSSPPRDTVGTLPLTVTIGPLADTPGGLARILRGEPIRLPVTFSAAVADRGHAEAVRRRGTEAGRPSAGARDRRRHRHAADAHAADDQHADAPALARPPIPPRRPAGPRNADDRRSRRERRADDRDQGHHAAALAQALPLWRFRARTCTEAAAQFRSRPAREYLARMSPLRLLLLLVPAGPGRRRGRGARLAAGAPATRLPR